MNEQDERFKPSRGCDARTSTTAHLGRHNPRSKSMDLQLRRERFTALADHFDDMAAKIEAGTILSNSYDQAEFGRYAVVPDEAIPDGEPHRWGYMGTTPLDRVPKSPYECGAHACVAGWAAMKFAPDALNVSFHTDGETSWGNIGVELGRQAYTVEQIGMEVLCMLKHEAELFSGGWEPDGAMEIRRTIMTEDQLRVARAHNARCLVTKLRDMAEYTFDGVRLDQWFSAVEIDPATA